MADTFTPKLGLRQYDASLNYAVSKFSADNLLIDNAIGTVICTSTTRPSTGLFNGMTLWETDTQRFVVRVSGAWVAVPNLITVADHTARNAITTKYDGQTIYRQDRDWIEVYDGAAWRVVGVAHCSSVADRDNTDTITSPYNGQLVVTTDTGTVWQRVSGAWTSAVNRLIAYSERTTTSSGSTSSAPVGVRRCDNIALRPGVRYRFSSGTLHPTSTVTSDVMRLEYRYNTSGVASTASAVLPGSRNFETWGNTSKIETFYTPAVSETVSILLCIARETGTGTVTLLRDAERYIQMYVEECPNVANTGTDV